MGTSGPEDLATAEVTTEYSIDKNYNCEVKLKGASADYVYRVSDAALRLASPVLAKMVDPKSPWAKKTSPESDMLTITLHDDNPEALAILFDLMHFQNQHIPKELDLKRIFHLALVCDKYDCVDVAKSLIHDFKADLKEAETDTFWKSFYTYKHKFEAEDTGDGTDADDEDSEICLHGDNKPAIANMLLYVSFVFSLEEIFPKAYRTYLMIWQPKTTAGEPDEVVSGPLCLPDRLYKHFIAEWEEKRSGIVNAVNEQIRKYTYGLVYRNPGRCRVNVSCTLCDISLYGSFIRRLHYLGLFPIQEKSDALSLHELQSRVNAIQLGHYWDNSSSAVFPHDGCLKHFMSAVKVAVKKAVKEGKVKLADFKVHRGVKRKLWVLEDGDEDEEVDYEGGDMEDDEPNFDPEDWDDEY
ncbi:hypothetical protein ABW21_db0205682 [Orbilia brochopaga]|nr:hypothetical protein ABW21_db0205682 [Drechslerella brochopaga]